MGPTTLGDAARYFTAARNNVAIRTRLDTLSRELSTGQTADLSRRLGADTERLADVDRRFAVAVARGAGAATVGQTLQSQQDALNRIDAARNRLVDTLAPLTLGGSADQRQLGADAAATAFASTVDALNTRFAGQALFAGAASDRTALADPATLLSGLRTAIAGLTSSADVTQAIADWFDQPGGGFQTVGYTGDTGPAPTRRIDDTTTVTLTARADDTSMRDLLKATAMAALAMDTGTALSDADRGDLLSQSNVLLIAAAAPLTALRATVGAAQAEAEDAGTRLTEDVSALSILRNGLTAADAYDTASQLQAVQVQLETHYTVTARLSRLSLMEYLR